MTDNTELLPNTILHGELLFASAIDDVIRRAEREILIFDADLSRGGYTSLGRAETLGGFLAGGRHRKLAVLLHDTDFLTHRCPRLMQLMRLFSHSFTVHKTGEEARQAQDSFVLVDGMHYVHRFHADHARFRYGLEDAAAFRALKERFDQIMETSMHSVSATTLGL
jgi:hypothetical protein